MLNPKLNPKPITLEPLFLGYLELDLARERLAKSPIGRNNVLESSGYSISSCDLEGHRLTIQISIRLPICTPIS